MNYEQAKKKAEELIQAQGEGERTASRYKLVAKDPTNLRAGWSVEGRPIGHHLDTYTAAD